MTSKTDNNQKLIVETLRKLGYTVMDTSDIGRGFPDLVASKKGINYLIEIKSKNGKFTEAQLKFYDKWQGTIYCIRSIDEAIEFAKGKKTTVIKCRGKG